MLSASIETVPHIAFLRCRRLLRLGRYDDKGEITYKFTSPLREREVSEGNLPVTIRRRSLRDSFSRWVYGAG